MQGKNKNLSNSNNAILPWFILGVFLIGVVFFTIQTATSGAYLANLEEQEAKLLKESKALKQELAESTSLIAVGEDAEEIGFGKPQKVIYIKEEDTVAKIP